MDNLRTISASPACSAYRVDMMQGNGQILRPLQVLDPYVTPHRRLRIMRFINTARPQQHSFSGNDTRPTKPKFNKIIRIVRRATSNASVHPDEKFPSLRKNSRNSDDYQSTLNSSVIFWPRPNDEINSCQGNNTGSSQTDQNENINSGRSSELSNFSSAVEVSDTQSDQMEPDKKYHQSLDEPENNITKKRCCCCTISKLCIFLSALVVLLIGAIIAGIVVGVLVGLQTATTTT